MKKFLMLFTVMMLCISMCSCGKSENAANSGETAVAENAVETTETPMQTEPPVQKDWILDYYVDDFNEPTSDWFVWLENGANGTFSNSAVTDARLAVNLLVDKESVDIFLLEYAQNYVKNNSSYRDIEYTITMKTDYGATQELTGAIYCGNDRITIDEKYRQTVLDALCNFEKVSFFIMNNQFQTTTYLFSVPSSNFSEVYQQAQS